MGDPARAQAKPSTDGPRNIVQHRRGRRQLNAAGTVTAEFIYANGINVPDAILTGGKTYALLRDHLGSVRLVVDVQTGAIAQQLAYDAFGQVTQDTNPGFQPFGFAGGLYDADTGLVHFGAREYDASIGRWISKDPIGFDGGQANLYVYADNDPINNADATGLSACTTGIIGVVLSCGAAGGELAVALTASVPTGGLAIAASIGVIAVQSFSCAAAIDSAVDACKPPPAPACRAH